MINTKMSLLIDEFSRMTQGKSLITKRGEALICQYDDVYCRVEDGLPLGFKNQCIILVKIEKYSIEPEVALRMNAKFQLTGDGYIAKFDDGKYFYVVNKEVPKYPQMLINYLSDTVEIVKNINEEIKKYVAN